MATRDSIMKRIKILRAKLVPGMGDMLKSSDDSMTSDDIFNEIDELKYQLGELDLDLELGKYKPGDYKAGGKVKRMKTGGAAKRGYGKARR